MNSATRISAALLLLGLLTAAGRAAQDNLLVLREKPGRKSPVPYDGASVEFLGLSLSDQLVHFASPETVPLRLSLRYRVTKPAPVLLNSRMGTEYWQLYHFARQTKSGLHTNERIDMAKLGEATTSVAEAQADPRRGVMLSKGLVGLVGHYLFLVDQPNGQWLGTARAPAFFSRPDVTRGLMFTLADLTQFSVAVPAVESTWEPGGMVRVKLAVTDADGDVFPVVNAAAELRAGQRVTRLAAERSALQQPTGWLAASLPDGPLPERIELTATVSAMTPRGPESRKVTASFRRGEGKKSLAEMRPDLAPVALPRNGAGQVRETRALWVSSGDMHTREQIDAVVAKAVAARLNVLVPGVLRRAGILTKSHLLPLTEEVEAGLDPLGYLVKQGHAKGLEVHPWFTVTYRRRTFRDRFGGVDMVDAKGTVLSRGADVHRPRYRDFIVNVMAGVARDYDVDGIHLDYVRSMGQCYCQACRGEFQAKFGRPIDQATEEDWIAWQREAIGDIVKRTAEGVRAARPRAQMSCAVFSNMRSGAIQGQDPARWAREGWMDVVIPMDYKMQTLLIRASEQAFLDALGNDDQLVTGLCLYQRSGDSASPRPVTLVQEQIGLVRRMGIHGYCLFAHTYLSDEIIKALRTEINREAAAPFFQQ